jgi:hypothetical protein
MAVSIASQPLAKLQKKNPGPSRVAVDKDAGDGSFCSTESTGL